MNLTHGTIGWVDLQSTDVDSAKAFYTALFGWTYEDMPTPMGVDYTMCYVDGQTVAGMSPQPGEMAAAGVPSMWNSYVMVEDADAVQAAVDGLGGSVLMPAMDVMDSGRMLMIAGPDGAVLGVWQPMTHQGAEVFGVPGALSWNELQSRDLEPAKAFLSGVFGWRWEAMPSNPQYFVCHVDDKPGDTANGGAMTMPSSVPNEAPSMWIVYFSVTDCDSAAQAVTELGGHVFMPPADMGPGRFAGANDPTGAMFFFGSFADSA